jgi:hypothetical protein
MRVATMESTTLATVGYDEADELLQREFRSGAVCGACWKAYSCSWTPRAK